MKLSNTLAGRDDGLGVGDLALKLWTPDNPYALTDVKAIENYLRWYNQTGLAPWKRLKEEIRSYQYAPESEKPKLFRRIVDDAALIREELEKPNVQKELKEMMIKTRDAKATQHQQRKEQQR